MTNTSRDKQKKQRPKRYLGFRSAWTKKNKSRERLKKRKVSVESSKNML